MLISSAGSPSIAIRPPWVIWLIISRSASGLPDISRPTSKPSCMSSSRCASASRSCADVHRAADPERSGQGQPVLAQVGDHHVPGPSVLADHRGHDADRPGPGDQHVLAQHRKGEGGVHRIAERVEDRRHAPVDRMPVHPGVAGGDGHVLRERPVHLYPDAAGVNAEVAAPGRQFRQRPHTRWPSPLTASPTCTSVTPEPTATTSPANSWPTVRGSETVRAAQASQDSMCRSVPQIPVARTATSTSARPHRRESGSHELRVPGPGAVLTRALTVLLCELSRAARNG